MTAPSILATMARSPGKLDAEPLQWNELARDLHVRYWGNEQNKARKADAARRQHFYAGGGDAAMCEMVGEVFKDSDVAQLREEWVKHAKHNNVLRRAINELATVYSAPATRTVEGPDGNADRYREAQRRVRQDEVMQRVNRLGYLHRAVFIYPRTRINASGMMEPVLEVVTPDRFDAICHPEDPTMLVAISIDLSAASALPQNIQPRRLLLTAAEMVTVSEAGLLGDAVPHGYGRIPGVLYCVDAPTDGVFDSRATSDLESAHRAVWFENILLLKESKSATRTTVITGDTSASAKSQADDTEHALMLQEGTSATTLDRSMDLGMFRATAQSIYETAAANHGIPPMTLHHDGSQSAESRELVRTPLKELRLTQQVALRDVERDLAQVQAAVYAPIPDVAFTTDGWGIDFADPQSPLGRKDSLDVFEKERQMGLTSTIAEIMRRNPDLSRVQAQALAEMWIQDETWRVGAMRDLQRMSGAMGTPSPAPDIVPKQPPNSGKADDLSWVEEAMRNAA